MIKKIKVNLKFSSCVFEIGLNFVNVRTQKKKKLCKCSLGKKQKQALPGTRKQALHSTH